MGILIMALSITANPDTETSAYNPVIWTITSSTSSSVRVISDVYIDGTKRASIDKDPRFGTINTFDFDIQSVCQDYLTENLETITATELVDADKSEVKVYLKIYDVTESGGVLTTAWEEDGTGIPDLTSGYSWAINTALQHEETQDLDAFSVETSDKRFLTHSPKTLSVKRTETIQLNFLSTGTKRGRLKGYDSSDVLQSSTTTTSFLPSDKIGIYTIDARLIATNIDYFIVTLEDTGAVTLSEEIRFNFDESCNDNALRLKWVNPLGGIDAYTFNAERREELRFSSSTYERVIEQGYAVKDRGDTILKTTGKDSIEIFSKALTKAELVWLSQIGLSNNVWIDEGSNVFVPVIVTSRKVKTLNSSNKIFQANFKLIKANERITQKG